METTNWYTETPEPQDEVLEQSVEESNNIILGTVVSPSGLNIREEPSRNGKVLSVVKDNSTVMIDLDGSENKWYKVCTESGIEGFCMKEYVTI